jgi:hypothetical protein
MTQQPASSPERTLARILSIAGRTMVATPDPWGYVRPSGVICAPDTSDVAHCLHGPDALFIAHARSDLPWLLDQLQTAQTAHRAVQAQPQRRLDWLQAAIRQANEELNKLPWQGDGLHGFVAEGLDPEQAQWICQVIRRGRQCPGPRGPRPQGRGLVNGVEMWAGPPAASGASAARPCQATPPSGVGVVAPLT